MDELDSTRSFKYITSGTVISHYRIIEKIGEGAMGQVYLAEDTRLRRRVALKFLPFDLTRDEEAKQRFLQEARVASSLDHPHICNIHEIEETPDGQTFICMAYYEGETLKDRIEKRPLEVKAALEIAVQICEGLTRAHEAGIIHRDIKPGNIMITERGRAKILDFGLAKLAGETQLTRTGTTLGTALYMSPEQARGDKVDGRSDVWSLGVVLYEMVTGKRPFKGANSSAIIYSILHDKADHITSVDKSLPRELGDIIQRCLSKNPGDRYQTAAALCRTLRKYADELGSSSVIAVPVPGFVSADKALRIALPAGIAAVFIILLLFTPLGNVFRRGPAVGEPPGERRVLLMQFDVDGEHAADRIYCAGLADYIAFRLRGLEGIEDSLWAVSRNTSIVSDITRPEKACLELGANVAIAGSLVCRGDSLTLELRRYDVPGPGEAVLSGAMSISDHRANLPAWQDSAAVDIARMLAVRITPHSRQTLSSGRTIVPAAFESYLMGLGSLMPPRKRGYVDTAMAWFEEALRQDASYALASARLGEVCRRKYVETGDREWADRSRAACLEAIDLDPRMVSARITLGRLEDAMGDSRAALRTLRGALVVAPLDRSIYPRIADIFQKSGDVDSAGVFYRRAADTRRRDALAQWSAAIFSYKTGKYDEAIEYYRRAIELAPQNSWFHNGLAASHRALRHYNQALRILEESLEVTPAYQTYVNLGTLYFYDARFADAARMYGRALQERPDAWYSVWGGLAECYYWIPGKRDTALVLLEHTVVLAEEELREYPDNADITTDLASYYAELGRTSEARTLVEKGASLTITDPATEFRIAEVYECIGERELAIEWAARCIGNGFPVEYVVDSPRFRALVADEHFRGIPEVKQYLDRELEGA
jgi:tetratricopeptide (TPR) repeat protein/predicted Ser/Thr protein kinase